ncbi:MAG: ScyD/ScyE family protein [Armatimonadota bacterium]
MKQLRLSRVLSVLTVTAAAACALLPASAAFAQYDFTLIMSNLDNPRGLAIGPDGGVYVTEAGRGGNGTTVTTGDGSAQSFGTTSGVSRFLGGVQSRVLSGAPSLAVTTLNGVPAPGNDASGLQDITFVGGQAYGLIGLGGNPAIRNSFTATENASGARFLGHLVTLSLDGSNTITSVADVSAYEAANNPAGGNTGDDVNSNPHSLVARPGGGFAVTDAGGNDVLNVSAGGGVSTISVLPARTFGPFTYQSVPTGITLGPDGSYYFTELTGFPFPAGAANIYRYNPITNQTSIAYTGFTNLLDVAFAPDGSLYALQLNTNGILGNPPFSGPAGPGVLTRIDTLGNRTNISSPSFNLSNPTALAIGADGAIYVSNQGSSAGTGQVIRITATAPEPGSLPLLAGGLLSLVGVVQLRRRRGAK